MNAMPPAAQQRPAFRLSLLLADWVLKHRWAVIAGLTAATLVFGYYASQITYDLGITKFYPDDSPYHAAYQSAEDLFGRDDARNLIAFEVDSGEAGAFRFLNALKLVKLAVSLGGTESLAEHPGTMTHSDIPPDGQLRMGITPGLVRLSVGVEHFEDIIADMEQALDAV